MAARTMRAASRSFWGWFEHHHIDSLAVLFFTLWLSWRVLDWALEFPYENPSYSGTDVAAILAAILTPWGITQGLLFKWYVDLKSRANGGANARP